MPNPTCLDCAKSLPPSFEQGGNKRCVRCAKTWRASAVCETCGTSLAQRRAARFCSQHCGDVARGQVRGIPLPTQLCAIPECAIEFTPLREGLRCCSERHGKMLWNRESRADGRQLSGPWSDRRRDNYHRRVALKKGGGLGRAVHRDQIAERDGYRCGLCRKKVNMTLPWPLPGSPSLDHIIPLTKGGIHDPVNIQLAHLSCNVAKGNRATGEQLLLIG